MNIADNIQQKADPPTSEHFGGQAADSVVDAVAGGKLCGGRGDSWFYKNIAPKIPCVGTGTRKRDRLWFRSDVLAALYAMRQMPGKRMARRRRQ